MQIVIRQGDILLIRTRSIPDGVVPVDRDARGRVILAEGETTGHCHAILDDRVTLFRQADMDEMADRFLRVEAGEPEAVELVHEEHSTLLIDAGDWILRRQREYAPEAPVYVAD